MKDALLSSKELWTCYQCGECAETCPTQADPSEFMAATRRYAIASYDRTRIARTMYTRPVVATLFAVLLAAFFALFMYSAHGPQSGESLAIFEFIPEGLIHNIGIVVMILVVARRAVAGSPRWPGGSRGARASAGQPSLGSRAALARSGPRRVGRDRPRVARPGPLPRGVRDGRGRGPGRRLVPPALARPRA